MANGPRRDRVAASGDGRLVDSRWPSEQGGLEATLLRWPRRSRQMVSVRPIFLSAGRMLESYGWRVLRPSNLEQWPRTPPPGRPAASQNRAGRSRCAGDWLVEPGWRGQMTGFVGRFCTGRGEGERRGGGAPEARRRRRRKKLARRRQACQVPRTLDEPKQQAALREIGKGAPQCGCFGGPSLPPGSCFTGSPAPATTPHPRKQPSCPTNLVRPGVRFTSHYQTASTALGEQMPFPAILRPSYQHHGRHRTANHGTI